MGRYRSASFSSYQAEAPMRRERVSLLGPSSAPSVEVTLGGQSRRGPKPRPSSLILSRGEEPAPRSRAAKMLDLDVQEYLATGRATDAEPEEDIRPVGRSRPKVEPLRPEKPSKGARPRLFIPPVVALPSMGVKKAPADKSLELDVYDYLRGGPRDVSSQNTARTPLTPLTPLSPLSPFSPHPMMTRRFPPAPPPSTRLQTTAYIHPTRATSLEPARPKASLPKDAIRSQRRAFLRAEVADYLTRGAERESYPQDDLEDVAMPPLRTRRGQAAYAEVRESGLSSHLNKYPDPRPPQKKLEELEFSDASEPIVAPVSLSSIRSRLLAACDLNDGAKRLYERHIKDVENVGEYTRKF